jgi:hypothetical protein
MDERHQIGSDVSRRYHGEPAVVTLEIVGDDVDLVCSIRPPSIYLDHWAWRLFAADRSRGNALLRSLDRRGTILVSVMNAREMARNTGSSAAELRSLLGAVGPRWFPIAVNPREVAEREEAHRPGKRSPYLSERLVQEPLLKERLARGDLSIAAFVDLTRGADGADLIATGEALDERVVDQITQRRSLRDRDRWLDDNFPQLKRNGECVTRAIYHDVVRRCIMGTFRFESTDVRDVHHLIVPAACSDFILLDPHWAEQLRQILHRLGVLSPRVFTRATVDYFLDGLDVWGSS